MLNEVTYLTPALTYAVLVVWVVLCVVVVVWR